MRRHVPDWVTDAVFYQIFPDRFRRGSGEGWSANPQGPSDRSPCGGDLEGIRQSIPHLQCLGVNALYLTPIFHAASYHKYDTINYYRVDPSLGDEAALRRLVSELHARGIRIILDGVFNHCGDRHPFFLDALDKGPASEYWSWFSVDGDRIRRGAQANYACWAGIGQLPEWNLRHPDVQEYLLNVVRFWLREYAIDGWRLDTTEYLPPDFVRQIYRASREISSDAYILGEVMGLGTPWFRHDAVDGVMHYRLLEFLSLFVAEERWDARTFATNVMKTWNSYPVDGSLGSYTLLSSHDSPRFLTRCGADPRKFSLALALQMTFPGAPAIYYGDEIGLEGHDDPDNRRCFPWNESDWNQEILTAARSLIALRKGSPTLRRGTLRFLRAEGRTIAYERTLGEDCWLISLNASHDSDARVRLPEGAWRDAQRRDGTQEREELALPALSCRILQRI